MNWYTIVWSFAGLVIGYLLGRFHVLGQLRSVMSSEKHGDRVPSEHKIGVMVQGDEVDRVLVKPSPVPRSIAIILVLLGAITIAVSIIGQVQRDRDQHRNDVKNCYLVAQIKGRGDESAQANARLAQDLGLVLSNTGNRAEAIAALRDLQQYYASRSQAAKQLPPLSAQDIKDCNDGTYDGGIGQ